MIKILMIYAFVVALLGFFLAIYVMGSLLSAPSQTIIGTAPTDLSVEEIKIQTKRGSQLSGWFIPSSLGKGRCDSFSWCPFEPCTNVRPQQILEFLEDHL